MYADDLTYITSDKLKVKNQLNLNIKLAKLEIFLNYNKLVINTPKTSIIECMIYQKETWSTGEPPHLVVEDPDNPAEVLVINDNKKFRILGTNILPNMSWVGHLDTGKKAILPKIRKQLGALMQLGKQLPKHSKKTLAEGLLISKFSYIITQWGGTSTNLSTNTSEQDSQMGYW